MKKYFPLVNVQTRQDQTTHTHSHAVVYSLVLAGLFILFSLLSPLGNLAYAQGDEGATWLVKMTPGASLPGGRHVIGDWWEVDEVQGLFALATSSHIVTITPNHLFSLDEPEPVFFSASPLDAAFPDDTYYSYQWHLPLVQADTAWPVTQGMSVTVAVLDTGVTRGTDLTCHTFVDPYNAVTGETGLDAVADDTGHGTHVTGTIAQCTNNGLGVAGMASKATIMPVKVMVDGTGSEAALARGIVWAVEHGADVINLSLGSPCGNLTWPQCAYESVDQAIAQAKRQGVLIVAAAGNAEMSSLYYPANHPDVMAVSAVGPQRELAWYSNYGDGILLTAPGGTDRKDANQDGYPDGVLQQTFSKKGWGYYFMQGTSMAAPHVTGAIALLKASAPHATPELLWQALTQTAQDLGDRGRDARYGYGLIQTGDALSFLHRSAAWTNTLFFPSMMTHDQQPASSSPSD